MNIINELKADKLLVKVYENREKMGEQSAMEVAKAINQLLLEKEAVNMIFAAAPSQDDFIAALMREDIEWEKINAFHMDEYIGLDSQAPQGFGNFLKDRLFGKKPFKNVFYLNGNANDLDEECRRYEALLTNYPSDIVCMGIGENGHIAFNDPHVAMFDDKVLVKVVDLDYKCRVQQVNDGCFQKLEEVPTHALTLTVPALVKPAYVFCVVPTKTKAEAVKTTVYGDIDESCPATILKSHDRAVLYTDRDSAQLL